MEGVLGKTTEELLAGIGSFTVVDRAEKPYGETGGLQGAFPAAMTGLRLNADGSGTVFYHDGSVASLHWSVAQAYGALVQIGCDELYLSDGVQYMFTAFGELTLTEEGPRLWIYNSFADEETCFAPESNIGE